jgi:hypothetical protein
LADIGLVEKIACVDTKTKAFQLGVQSGKIVTDSRVDQRCRRQLHPVGVVPETFGDIPDTRTKTKSFQMARLDRVSVRARLIGMRIEPSRDQWNHLRPVAEDVSDIGIVRVKRDAHLELFSMAREGIAANAMTTARKARREMYRVIGRFLVSPMRHND